MRAVENYALTDPWIAIARVDDDAAFAPAWLDRAVAGLGGAAQVREAVLSWTAKSRELQRRVNVWQPIVGCFISLLKVQFSRAPIY